MTTTTGSLYMIPVPISENAVHTLSPEVYYYAQTIKHFFVEHVREARRFLKIISKEIDVDQCFFSEINRNTIVDKKLLTKWLKAGNDVGVMSDAGCPGIADPGADLALAAHKIGARVIPLAGPSSILLALMASGLSGQNFAFQGYLPVKEPERSKKIKALEVLSAKEKQTQLFIETPYRNNNLLADLLKNCQPGTLLCIAMHVSSKAEKIVTKSIAEWAQQKPQLEKEPTIFLLLVP